MIFNEKWVNMYSKKVVDSSEIGHQVTHLPQVTALSRMSTPQILPTQNGVIAHTDSVSMNSCLQNSETPIIN